MFQVTNILNPITGGSTTHEYKWVKGKSLSDYVGFAGECVVTYNGEIIDLPIDEIYPARRDEYRVMPVLEGTDKQTQRIIGYAALSAAAMLIPGAAPGFHGLYMTAQTKGAFLWFGGTIISLFLRDKDKDQPTSQSYQWRHMSSPGASHGSPMPIIYGKARVRPTLKNRYVKVIGDKQYLYALYGLATHKVDERVLPTFADAVAGLVGPGEEFSASNMPGVTFVYPVVYRGPSNPNDLASIAAYLNTMPYGHGTGSFYDDVVINGRSISDYNVDVDWDTRPGLPQQTYITDFDATYTNYSQDVVLYVDAPAVDWGKANIRYSSIGVRILRWTEHTISFHGTEYTIKGNETGVILLANTTYYIYYDNATYPNKYFVATLGNTPVGSYLLYKVNTNTGETEQLSSTLPDDTTWYSPVTTLTGTHNIEAVFNFPRGLYETNSQGDIKIGTGRVFAQYKKLADSTWTDFDFVNLAGTTFDFVKQYTSMQAGVLKRKTFKDFSISVSAVDVADPLDPSATYQVRVCADSFPSVRFVNLATVVYGEEDADGVRPGFTYPGEPLLGIKALASGQISGDLDVQVDVERSLVWVYDEDVGDWVEKAANNHAWAVYDILVQGHPDHPAYPAAGNDDAEAIYGCGLSKDRIDYDSFKEWADNVIDIEYELNIVFDTFMTAWDAILRICQEGRGMVYPIGTKIHAFTDKAEDVTQVFTMGNIRMDTFAQKFVEENQKINMIEATYYDEDRNYEKTMLATRTADWDTDTRLSTPTSLTFHGTTAFAQAWSLSRYMLRGNELLNNIIAFGVDIDTLAAQAGDVVEVQHDILTTGTGGRIVAVTGTLLTGVTITLDRTITLDYGQSYQLIVVHNDGTTSTQNGITGGTPGNPLATTQIAFDNSWSWSKIPEVYELYSFGIANEHVEKYRVAEISRTTELMRTVTLVQYDATLYDSYKPSDLPSAFGEGYYSTAKIVASDGNTVADLLNLASNVQLREVLTWNDKTGRLQPSIVVTWDAVPGDPRGSWEVWFRDVDASDVEWEGTWEQIDGGYDLGAKVEYNGKTYINLEFANASQPL